MKYFVFFIFTGFILSSCSMIDNQESGCVCTAVFVSVGVVVVDQNNDPVDSLNVTVKNLISGKVYDFHGENRDYFGRYIVMTDGYVKDFSTFPQTINFTGRKGNTEISSDFQIITDECKCHVGKLSGLDTLRINL
jgi:hypothetical protein